MFKVIEPEARYRIMATYGTIDKPEWFLMGYYRWRWPTTVIAFLWTLRHPWGGAEIQMRVPSSENEEM